MTQIAVTERTTSISKRCAPERRCFCCGACSLFVAASGVGGSGVSGVSGVSITVALTVASCVSLIGRRLTRAECYVALSVRRLTQLTQFSSRQLAIGVAWERRNQVEPLRDFVGAQACGAKVAQPPFQRGAPGAIRDDICDNPLPI